MMAPEIDWRKLEAAMPSMEAAGYAFCISCGDWEEDTDCFGDYHSRHCGHLIKPAGLSFSSGMVMICIDPLADDIEAAGKWREFRASERLLEGWTSRTAASIVPGVRGGAPVREVECWPWTWSGLGTGSL